MIRDRIVFGTNSSKIREKLINVGAELTLEKAIQIAQSFEYAQQQLRSMGRASGEEVHMIRRPNKGNSRPRGKTTPDRQSHGAAGDTRRQASSINKKKQNTNMICGNCGRDHISGAGICPAKGKTCHTCGKLNHFK